MIFIVFFVVGFKYGKVWVILGLFVIGIFKCVSVLIVVVLNIVSLVGVWVKVILLWVVGMVIFFVNEREE